MSNNPYVNIDRVIDTRDGQRKVVDFLHQRTFTNVHVSMSSFLPVTETAEQAEGSYYADITLPNFTIKETHIPIVLLDTNINLTLDKDNFPTCVTINNGVEVVIRLYASMELPPTGSLTIPMILLVEAK